MLYTPEGLSEFDPKELKSHYRTRVDSMQKHLLEHEAEAVSPIDGLYVYAAHLDPDEALNDEDEGYNALSIGRLLLVTEVRGSGFSMYNLSVLHLGETHGSIVAPPESGLYRTNFKSRELPNYDPETADMLCKAVEEAAVKKAFDPFEASVWVNALGAKDDQKRRKRRASRALTDMLVGEIAEEIDGIER